MRLLTRADPVQTDWHMGSIVQQGGGLRWINKAGVGWSLTPDLANRRLLTGTDNPYYQQGHREFALIIDQGQSTGFKFAGGTFLRVPAIQVPADVRVPTIQMPADVGALHAELHSKWFEAGPSKTTGASSAAFVLDSSQLNLSDGQVVAASWSSAAVSGAPVFRLSRTPNGKPAVEFDGKAHLGNVLIGPSATKNFVIVAVLRPEKIGAYHNIVDGVGGVPPMLWIDPANRYELNIDRGKKVALGTGPGGWDIVIADSRSNTLYVNGTVIASEGRATDHASAKSFGILNRGGAQAFKGLLAELRIYNTRDFAPAPEYTVAMVTGRYQRSPVLNDWHIGSIVEQDGGLRWNDKAGHSWSLTPDLANRQLLIGTDNPYYQQGRREFALIIEKGQVAGFKFGGEAYLRQAEQPAEQLARQQAEQQAKQQTEQQAAQQAAQQAKQQTEQQAAQQAAQLPKQQTEQQAEQQARIELTPESLVGSYRSDPVRNPSRMGSIVLQGGDLRWINKAGANWSLTPDLANGRLLTGRDNPYYRQGHREFTLIVQDHQITGFQFAGGTFLRESAGGAGRVASGATPAAASQVADAAITAGRPRRRTEWRPALRPAARGALGDQDQSWTPSAGQEQQVRVGASSAQTFTARKLGLLSTVALSINRQAWANSPLIVEIRAVDDQGRPTRDRPLYVEAFPPSVFPLTSSAVLTALDVRSAGIQVAPGDRLAVAVRNDSPVSYDWRYADGYSAGQGFVEQSGGWVDHAADFAFQTEVDGSSLAVVAREVTEKCDNQGNCVSRGSIFDGLAGHTFALGPSALFRWPFSAQGAAAVYVRLTPFNFLFTPGKAGDPRENDPGTPSEVGMVSELGVGMGLSGATSGTWESNSKFEGVSLQVTIPVAWENSCKPSDDWSFARSFSLSGQYTLPADRGFLRNVAIGAGMGLNPLCLSGIVISKTFATPKTMASNDRMANAEFEHLFGTAGWGDLMLMLTMTSPSWF